MSGASATIADLRLEEHGLRWCHAPAVVGQPMPQGGWALLQRDRRATADALEADAPGDGAAWLELCDMWDRVGGPLIASLMSPFPPVRGGARVAWALRRTGGLTLVKSLLAPATHFARTRFAGPRARALIFGNAAHADVPLDASGSALMGVLLCMIGQTVGWPVPEGGAGMLAEALARRATSRGADIRCDARVTEITCRSGRVEGVVLADGTRLGARRAVLADVAAPALFERLLSPDDVPQRVRTAMRDFQWDPGTVKVDWALDAKVPWRDAPADAPGTVHVARDERALVTALTDVSGGWIPADPFLLAGQMTTADPTRSPAGTESLWAYTHVPHRVTGDAGGDGLRGVWDDAECVTFADRMEDQIERYAPGFRARVVARRIFGPRQLEAMNENLMGGAVNGGTSQLHQQLVFRPTPGFGGASTPVRGLFLASSSAHPGGGVHGACGMNAARAALAASRRGRLRPTAE